MENHKKKYKIYCIATMFVLLILMLSFPEFAFADNGNKVNFSSVISSLQFLTSAVFLPLGVLFAAWKIIYLSAICGIAGIDPLNLFEGTPGTAEVWAEVKNHLKGFAYGMAWVAGIWILFQAVLGIVSIFAGALTAVF